MEPLDGMAVSTEVGEALCALCAAEKDGERWQADEAMTPVAKDDQVLCATAGLTLGSGGRIAIEAWARDVCGWDLSDDGTCPLCDAHNDQCDEPGRETEMPDEDIVGGWLGTDDNQDGRQ